MTKMKRLAIAKRMFALSMAAAMAFSAAPVFAEDAATNPDAPAASTTQASGDQTSQAATPEPVGTKFTYGNYEYKVTGANTVTLMGFAGTAEATYVKVRKQVTYKDVTYIVNKIATKAFVKESCIEKVLIRKNVTDIGRRAFFQCKNLESVRIKTGLKVAALEDVKANAFKNVNTNLVINVATKAAKKMLKESVPSYITINKAFNSSNSNSNTDNNTGSTDTSKDSTASSETTTATTAEGSTATTATTAADAAK